MTHKHYKYHVDLSCGCHDDIESDEELPIKDWKVAWCGHHGIVQILHDPNENSGSHN